MKMTITQFKAKCLDVVERVQREKIRAVISRHGRAPALLVPIDGAAGGRPLSGRAAGNTKILVDLLSTGEPWNAEY